MATIKKNQLVLICFSALIIFIQSCSNNEEQKASQTSTVKNIDSLNTQKVPAVVINELPAWKNFMATAIPRFDENNFTETYVIPWEKFEPLPITPYDLAFYKPYIAYNNDSTQAVDVYSYNLKMGQRNGRLVALQGEPDSQINLIDLKNNTSRRIYFAGPATTFWDAKYINDDEVLVTGSEQNKPAYWVIILAEKKIQQYDYADSINTLPRRIDYLKQKMPGVNVH